MNILIVITWMLAAMNICIARRHKGNPEIVVYAGVAVAGSFLATVCGIFCGI